MDYALLGLPVLKTMVRRVTAALIFSAPAFAAVTVLVGPTTVTLGTGMTQQFIASVSGTTNTGVKWTTTGGTVTPSGLYTAPSATGTYKVTATSLANSRALASATVTVVAPSLSISPSAPKTVPGAVTPFSATVMGLADTRVTWSASAGACIQGQGSNPNDMNYTAPALTGTYSVTATSVVNPSVRATTQVQVVPVLVTWLGLRPEWNSEGSGGAPNPIGLVPFGNKRFSATVSVQGQGTGRVQWSCTGGSLSSTNSASNEWVTYTAPLATGSYTITATSTDDPTYKGSWGISVAAATTANIYKYTSSKTFTTPGEAVDLTAWFSGTGILDHGIGAVTSGAPKQISPRVAGRYQLDVTKGKTSLSEARWVLPMAPKGTFSATCEGSFGMGTGVTPLPSGKVLLSGGYVSYNTYWAYSDALDVYDPATGQVTRLGRMMGPRLEHAAIVLPDGMVLIAGGIYSIEYGDRRLSSWEIWNPVTGVRVASGNLREPRHHAAAVLMLDGRVYFGGGAKFDNGWVASGEIFDPVTQSSTAISTAPEAFQGGGTLQPDGRILLSAGMSYDPATDSYTVLGSRTVDRNLFLGESYRLMDGRMLVFNGLQWTAFDPGSGISASMGQGTSDSSTFAPLSDGRLFGYAHFYSSELEDARGGIDLERGCFMDPAEGGGQVTQTIPAWTAPLNAYFLDVLTAPLPSQGKVLVIPRVGAWQVFNPEQSLFLDQVSVMLKTGYARTFRAMGPQAASVVWSVRESNGGSITQEGRYTAPSTPGIYHVVATSTVDASVKAMAEVLVLNTAQVISSAIIQSFTADQTIPAPGASVQLLPVFEGGTGVIQPGAIPVQSGVAATVTPSTTTTYTLVVMDPNGAAVSLPLTIYLTPTIDTFTGPSVLIPGSGGTLSWKATPGASLELKGDSGGSTQVWTVTGMTSQSVCPSGTTTYTLTATNPAGQTTATKTVIVSPVLAIGITPTTQSLVGGTQAGFARSLSIASGYDASVSWKVNELGGGTLVASGSLSEQATYTAPSTPGNYTVTVSSVADPSRSATALVTVTQLTVSLTPSYLELAPGGQFGFGYSTNAGGLTLSASGGTLGQDGRYVAPSQAGTYTLTATSALDPSVTATATVVVKPVQILVSPKVVTLAKNGTYRFAALCTSGSVTWSVAGGGSITADGVFTAPSVDGTYTVVATSTVQASVTATATVVVQDGGLSSGGGSGGGSSPTPIQGGVSLEPLQAEIPSGTYQVFNATVFGVEDQSVTWDVTQNITDSTTGRVSGTLDDQGVFTAGLPGFYVVRATSKVNGSLVGTAVIRVVSGVQRLFNSPAALNREYYSVTALKTGKILIAGGFDGTDVMGTSYLFDPETKAYTETGAMVVPRSGHKTVLLQDGRVLVSQGYGNRSLVTGQPIVDMGPLPNAEVYDPATGTWSSFARFDQWDVNVGGASVALSDGRALILGGETQSGTPWSNALLFDGAGTFTTVPFQNLGWGKWFPMVQLQDGRVFYSGGYTGQNRPDGNTDADWEIMQGAKLYNPVDGTSVAAGTMTSKRMNHTATVLPNGKVLLVGGISHNRVPYGALYAPEWEPTATAEIFDPATGTFTPTGSLQLPRTGHDAILLPTGQVQVVGGWTRMEVLADGTPEYFYQNSVETYDPGLGTWKVTDLLMNGDVSYGLDSPKQVLQADGGVFLAGKPIFNSAPAPTLSQTSIPERIGKLLRVKGRRGEGGRKGPDGGSCGQTMDLAPTLAPGDTPLNAIFGITRPPRIGLLAANCGKGKWDKFNFGVQFLNKFATSPLITPLWLNAGHFQRMVTNPTPIQMVITHAKRIDYITVRVPSKKADGSPLVDANGDQLFEEKRFELKESEMLHGIESHPAVGTDPGDFYELDVTFDAGEYGQQTQRVRTNLLPLPSPTSGVQPREVKTDILVLGYCWSSKAYDHWQPVIKPMTNGNKSVILTFNVIIPVDYLARALAAMLEKNVWSERFVQEFNKIAPGFGIKSSDYQFYYQ